jgi:hypothetical protein
VVSPELAQVFEAYYAAPRESNAASPGRYQLGLVHWNSLSSRKMVTITLMYVKCKKLSLE